MAAGHTTPRESGTGAANRMTQRTNAAPADAPTRTHLYAAFDCVVESDLPLPLLSAAEGGEPCLRVRRGDTACRSAAPGEPVSDLRDAAGGLVYRVERHGGQYLWRYPDLGEFTIAADGSTVLWDAADAQAPDMAAALAGPVIGFALQLQGRTSLHGSAVVVDGHAIGLIAPSGHGKSTLAAALLDRGAALLTDDVLMLRAGGDAVRALPGPSCMKLWPDALDGVVGLADWEALPRHASWLEKRVLRVDARPAAGRVPGARSSAQPLGALFVLWPSTADSPIERTRLRGRDALMALVANGYNAHLLALEPRLLAVQLDLFRTLVRDVPVSVLRYPRSFARIAGVADAVVAWGSAGGGADDGRD